MLLRMLPRLSLTPLTRSPLTLAWVCASLVLVLLPLTLAKPGWPPQLKGDEPANYLMALSLWHDGDLRCETQDIDRLFHEFTQRTENLALMTLDGWRTVYFSTPLVYPLFAAPAAGLFGANGMMAFNAALMMLMIALGTNYLRQFNRGSVAALFAVGFFVLSCGFVYVFWLQTEIFNMTCVLVSFFLVWRKKGNWSAWAVWLALAGSGISLALVTYSKPMLGALALPLLYISIRRRGWKAAVAWCLSAAMTLALLAGLAFALTKTPWPYFVPSRRAVTVGSPIDFMERKVSASVQPSVSAEVEQGVASSAEPSSSQVSRWGKKVAHYLRRYDPRRVNRPLLVANGGYFLWGRHVGLLLYMPFAALCILLFLLHDWRSKGRWLILAALVVSTLAYLLLLPSRWHGGGGSIGNRYMVIAYPAFLFLVTRIRPAWSTAVGYGLGGLFLGPLLLTPFGAQVDDWSLQAYVRSAPFRYFPFELTLARNLDGYHGNYQSGAWIRGRADALKFRGDELWVQGASDVEAWMLSEQPLPDAMFRIRSGAPSNTVDICLEDSCERVEFDGVTPADTREVVLRPEKPWRWQRGSRNIVYRLRVKTSAGEQPTWRRNNRDNFYLGAALTYLGSSVERDRDLFHVEWNQVDRVGSVEAGSRFQLPATLKNAGQETWTASGATRVHLSYHWLDEAGQTVVRDGIRSRLSSDVAPGDSITVVMDLIAPEETGQHSLVLDLVREHVAWFSDRNEDAAISWVVDVLPPG